MGLGSGGYPFFRWGYSLFIAILFALSAWAPAARASIWANEDTPAIDVGTGPVERGYIVPRVRPAPGGAKLTVDIYHASLDSSVTLVLQAVINDGKGTPSLIDIEVLSNGVNDNQNSYRSHREFFLDYAKMEAQFRRMGPQATGLSLTPGTPMFVYASWGSGHQWGGPYRSGGFYLPPAEGGVVSSAPATPASTSTARPNILDVAYPIPQSMANSFNINNGANGLKAGGQVRSRVEGEGKIQLSPQQFQSGLQRLLQIAGDPAQASVLPQGWTIQLETRYLKKQANGQIEYDAQGLPIPDPMVDTYYDNATFDAAKNDMALRYRWTEGNQTGAWNFKPGMGMWDNGIVYRVEYGLDATDDQPASIASFVDSYHPLNAFSLIRRVIPGAVPSQFLTPAIRLTDYRYKFILKHQNGLAIEVSADDVRVQSLRTGNPQPPEIARYFQLEMDIEHLATQSQNGVGVSQLTSGMSGLSGASLTNYLQALTSNAFFDGRPVLHSMEDLRPDSPVRTQKKGDFDLATTAIVALRDALVGAQFVPGAQKYAFAAHAAGLVVEAEASASVKQVISQTTGNSVTCLQKLTGSGN